jgi:uncharacterized protein
MNLSKYCILHRYPEDRGLITLFSTRTTSAVAVTREVIKDIEKGSLPKEERKTLLSEGLLVKDACEEKQEMLRFVYDLNAGSDTFDAVVVLNLDCNLACKYCFEGSRKGKHYLSAETADDFIDFIQSNGLEGKDEISLIFYGGEPLLSTDMIVRISEKITAITDGRGIDYAFALITNGTLLTPRNVEKLKPLGLKGASVTLDGPKDVHDAFRPFKSGNGSFDAIVENIRNVCELIDVQIGGNYTQDYYREFPRLLDHFLDSGLTPDNISQIRFDPVVNDSSEFAPPDFHDGCMSANEPWLIEAGIFLREEILKRGFRTQEIAPAVCMIERCDHVVVNFDGSLYKCPGLIGRKEFCVGDVKTGLRDYSLTHCLGNWKNEECLACSYLPLCFGGCRYMKLLQDGNINGVNCRKEYFDKTLAQFVAQDIKYDL